MIQKSKGTGLAPGAFDSKNDGGSKGLPTKAKIAAEAPGCVPKICADANVEASVRVPGISFAEWGPGDHGFFILGRPGAYAPGTGREAMQAVRARVLAATKASKTMFLNSCSDNPKSDSYVIDMIKDGTMICTGGDSPAADIGRKFTKRTDPF